MRALSVTVTWALENAVVTADSMKSRGYGLPGRTAFARQRFDGRDRRFAALHTYMNKLTGAAVFVLPYFLRLPFAPAYCWAVCGIAALASTEELLIHLRGGEYNANKKTIFELRKL